MSDTAVAAEPVRAPDRAGLHRELGFIEAVALSIAMMAPTAAMALNGTAVAAQIGRAVPLAFIVATIGVMFVSWSFIRLSRHVTSAGSVLALAGTTLGPRAGFFAGWGLFGTYLAFTIASIAEVGIFGEAFFGEIGGKSPDWLILALGGAALVVLLAYRKIRVTTRSLLGFEAVSILLILILLVIIVAKLIGGSAPEDRELTFDVFVPPSGIALSAVATAAVFGFLSFGGFEGAATLGEETADPRRNIPRAIGAAVLVAGTFYIIVTIVQALGFGANEAGATRFSESASPFGDLSNDYAGSGLAAAIDLGAAISAFAAGLGAATAASRLLYSFGRDAFGAGRVVRTSGAGAPVVTLTAVIALTVVALVGLRIGDVSAVNAFFYPGTLGVLALLVAYVVTTIGAMRFLFFQGELRAPRREFAIPVVALVILGYVLYKNTDPGGLEMPYEVFPLVVAGWLLVGLGIVLARADAARRIGASFVPSDGPADRR